MLALGANRAANNVPIIPGTVSDVSGTGGTTAFSGIIAHEALGYDIVNASYQFNAPSGGNGYEYSLLVVAASPVVATRLLSRQSIEAITGSTTTNRLLSRQSVEVLTPSKLRFRGWGIRY